jgi:hypothetical protein
LYARETVSRRLAGIVAKLGVSRKTTAGTSDIYGKMMWSVRRKAARQAFTESFGFG